MKRYYYLTFILIVMAITISPVYANQMSPKVKSAPTRDSLNDVRLFQTFFRDATISTRPYIEGGLRYDDYDHASVFVGDVKGGGTLFEHFEMGTHFGIISVDPDRGSIENGILDLFVCAKYDFSHTIARGRYNMKTVAGGYFTLPTGDEDSWQDNTNFGGFSAIRYPLKNRLVLTGVMGFDFIEVFDHFDGDKDRKTSILVGFGTIFPVDSLVSVVSEFNFHTEGDYVMLTGGIDYKMHLNGRVRGMIGFGLDDGAPDFSFRASYLYSF